MLPAGVRVKPCATGAPRESLECERPYVPPWPLNRTRGLQLGNARKRAEICPGQAVGGRIGASRAWLGLVSDSRTDSAMQLGRADERGKHVAHARAVLGSVEQ